MQSVTLFVLVCLASAVLSRPEADVRELGAARESARLDYDAPAQADHGAARAKRSLLLLKKKLLLGALGLKAAKMGAVGAAGVAGALALKKKAHHPSVSKKVVVDEGYHGYSSVAPHYNVEVHSWSG